jgi:hypothetical protein
MVAVPASFVVLASLPAMVAQELTVTETHVTNAVRLREKGRALHAII